MKAILRLLLPALLLAEVLTAADETDSVSQLENTLAKAVRTRNKAVLSSLTDQAFHISWSQGTAIRGFQTDVSREGWMDDVDHLRFESYEVEISKVDAVGKEERNRLPLAAHVRLTEFWTIVSNNGRRIDKRVECDDFWIKKEGTWKLTSRLSRSGPSAELLPLFGPEAVALQ